MNEIPSVATNGSWVRRMVKISAGSSGARRDQSPEGRRVGRAWADAPAARRPLPTATLIGPLLSGVLSDADCARGRESGRSLAEASLIALRDVPGELLSLIEGLFHAHLTRDGGTDVLRDLGLQGRELGDVHELDARGGAGLDPGILWVGIGDRVSGRGGERGRHLEVLGIPVGRAALACRDAGPADLFADQLLVVLARGP